MATINACGTQITLGTNFEVRQPLQSAFLVYLSATQLDVTGNNTYLIPCDAEVFDQNADYDTATGVFTAPMTGRYAFAGSAIITGLTLANRAFPLVITSNRNYVGNSNSPIVVRNANGYSGYVIASLTDMDAGDTANLSITVSGEAGNTVDVYGSANCETFFSGCLEC